MKFSKSTEPLIEFFIDNFKKFYKKRNKEQQFKLDNIYKIIYNDLNTSKKYINLLTDSASDIIEKKYVECKLKYQIPRTSLLYSKYIPNNILKYILSPSNTVGYLRYSTTLIKSKIEVFFVLYDENDLLDLSIYDNYFNNMLIWLRIANKYSRMSYNKKLTIYIYLTPFKKELPKNIFDVFGPEHCNSGLTTVSSSLSEICIFRKEEFFKVFIHETFHFYKLDFSSFNQSEINEHIKNIFPIESEFNLFEAYTEFWATIFNNAFISMNNLKNVSDSFDDFVLYLDFCNKIESMFSLFQLNKILKALNMDYTNLYENDRVSNELRTYMYKEDTNLFAYYIVKCILLYNFEDFLEWCNKSNIILFKYNKYINKNEQFVNFIEKKYNNEDFILELKKMKCLNNNYKVREISNLKNTTRMTLLELRV